jgi:signal transduction histidine kinase
MPNTGLVPLLRRTLWISIVTIGAIGLSVLAVAIAQRSRDRWTQHSRDVVRLARRAQLLAVDRETGVRGFLLTGDSASLAPDAGARVPLGAALDSLVRMTGDNPSQQDRARSYAAAIARWDSVFATPVLARRLTLDDSARLALVAGGRLAGKLLFDDVRRRFTELESEEERLYRRRRDVATMLQTMNVVISVIGLAILAVMLAVLRGRAARQAAALVDRQALLEEQATELEEQASELQQQAAELEAQTEDLQQTINELARRNDDLNAFSASVAHDLRSPLRSIDGFSHMLATDYGDRLGSGGVGTLDRIRANAQRMGEMIDGLLGLARVSGAELRKTSVNLSDIASAVGDEVRSLSPDRGVEYVVQPGLTARGDSRLLQVAIRNLVENAFKFTRTQRAARIEVAAKRIDGEHVFLVADNGIGFDMRYADKLFGEFERLHDDGAYEGTGVGLATVRRVIERHGGRIWADARPGRGATFYFTIPD